MRYCHFIHLRDDVCYSTKKEIQMKNLRPLNCEIESWLKIEADDFGEL